MASTSTSTTNLSHNLPSETLISGPHHLYDSCFTMTYLQPHPTRNASALMLASYDMSHPETHLGKKYA